MKLGHYPAARALAKINSLGEWFEKEDHRVYVQRMFDQMTKDELEAYAREGTVPEWFGGPAQRVGGEPKGGGGQATGR
ncbi:MAG TPA: hypothetical protein VGS20_12135 [Candidatus Acidoferrales bacterium]|nr:hypothetical protein [Candidatus Acidoferrales bacterium]